VAVPPVMTARTVIPPVGTVPVMRSCGKEATCPSRVLKLAGLNSIYGRSVT
jgi:hypothetical protein